MSEEDRLKLENELLLTKSKAQMINLYLDLQQKVEQLEKDKSYANWYAVKKENEALNRFCKLYVQSLYNADLTKAEKRVEQLENIRKEAIKYIEDKMELTKECPQDLLNILNKGSEE